MHKSFPTKPTSVAYGTLSMCVLTISYHCTHAFVCVADLWILGLRANANLMASSSTTSMATTTLLGSGMVGAGEPVNPMPIRLVPEPILVPCCP